MTLRLMQYLRSQEEEEMPEFGRYAQGRNRGHVYDFTLQEAIDTASNLIASKGWLLGWPLLLLLRICRLARAAGHYYEVSQTK